MGKGDQRRPENLKAFKAGFERTFGKAPSDEDIARIEARRARVLTTFEEDQRRLREEAKLEFDRATKQTTAEDDDDSDDGRETDDTDYGSGPGIPCC